MANYWKSVICVGSGNEGTAAGHTSGVLKEGQEQRVELGVQQREPALNVQLWKSYVDEVDISVIAPSGIRVGPISERLGTQRFRIGGTEILLYYGKPSPYQTNQEIYFDFIPTGSYIDSGVWQIVLTPRKVVTGIYQMWLPSERILNRGTAFLNPVSSDTLTIPSTAEFVWDQFQKDLERRGFGSEKQKSCFTTANQAHIRPIRRFILISSQRVLILTAGSGGLY